MKILFLQWNGIGNEDMTEAFISLGHEVIKRKFDIHIKRNDEEIQEIEVERWIKDCSCECVFSFNFFPTVSKVCHKIGTPYISWVYDSPYANLYHYSLIYPTNYVFVFDSSVFSEFYSGGIRNVFYLPMAANTERLRKMNDMNSFSKTYLYNRYPVSFVGSLYDEKHNFFERMEELSDYTKGFLEGIINAQKEIYGANFIQRILQDNPNITNEMKEAYDIGNMSDGIASDEYLYAQYFINRRLTAIERKEQLSDVAKQFGLDLYTHNKDTQIEGCVNHGPVDFYDWAPYVFKNSKVNLNISLRSIINGIPLRCFDIMGSGGFLLTNFQQDFLNHFNPDEDFVYYESEKDLVDKIDYYLKNEDERIEIALNGFKKVAAEHTYIHRAAEMLSFIQ